MSGHELFSSLRTIRAIRIALTGFSDDDAAARNVFELLVTNEGLVDAVLKERMQRAVDRNAIRAHAERTKLFDYEKEDA